ncbi:macrocin O-methyltransferase [Hanstruepera neustonica]|uniref:Macrocin O-methyltransferase n=1 Tax=Hanstruepera neustonica TaxID=1445657 RepID=A0A2K1DVM0_9FLAO|nr:TylF/MycF/NovP-related O-methyltransferase [Hanstruepera neustonica]PNQ72086.1 macrocin O-methyltransferase [Hanstruepera neustonica]
MKLKFTTTFKILISKLLPDSEKLRYLFWLPKLHTFHRKYGRQSTVLKSRKQLYQFVNSYISNEAITYCEFGVFQGASIRYWAQINDHVDSRFFGFDTFSGLPESWNNFTGGLEKGTFDTKGLVPDIKDDRVSFYKGLFQDTLPDFLLGYQSDKLLVINIDADLYSSTLFVLTMGHKILKKGSVILFDEFSSVLHEFRAFEDYCAAYGVCFEVIAYTKSKKSYYSHVAIKIL